MSEIKKINKSILQKKRDGLSAAQKNTEFYKYLFNNKIGYYYSKYISTSPTEEEKWILKKGDELNKKYTKTLELLNKVSKEKKIEFLLFKTHKYIDEVVDGDIDILVKKKDFYRVLDTLQKNGFYCVEDELLKGKCQQKGYATIEPHCNISWGGRVFIKNDKIWKNKKNLKINNINIKNCSNEIELLVAIGEIFYSPEYIDLYTFKKLDILLKSTNINEILNVTPEKNKKIIEYFLKEYPKIRKNSINKKLPYFIPSTKLALKLKKSVSYSELSEIVFKNIYWKYRYLSINKLPFTHDWKN